MAALDPNEALFAHYRALHEPRRALRDADEQRARVGAAVAREAAGRRDLRDRRRLRLRRAAQAGPGDLRARARAARAAGRRCAFVDDLAVNVEAARALGFAVVHFRDTEQAIAELDALLGAVPASRSGRRADERARRDRRRARRAPSPRPTIEAPLLDALRADGDLIAALSLVARARRRAGRRTSRSAARSVARHGAVLALGPIGVVPEHQGTGAGAALMRAVPRRGGGDGAAR